MMRVWRAAEVDGSAAAAAEKLLGKPLACASDKELMEASEKASMQETADFHGLVSEALVWNRAAVLLAGQAHAHARTEVKYAIMA